MNPDSPSQTPGQQDNPQLPSQSTPVDQVDASTQPAPSEQPNIAEAQGQQPSINLTNTAGTPNGVLSEADAGVRPLEHPAPASPDAPVTPASEPKPLGEVARAGGLPALESDVEQTEDKVDETLKAEEPQAQKDAKSVLDQVDQTLKDVEAKLKTFGSAELTLVKRKLEEAQLYAQKHLQNTKK